MEGGGVKEPVSPDSLPGFQVPQSNGFQEWGAPLDGEIGNNQNSPLSLACMASGHGRNRDILS